MAKYIVEFLLFTAAPPFYLSQNEMPTQNFNGCTRYR